MESSNEPQPAGLPEELEQPLPLEPRQLDTAEPYSLLHRQGPWKDAFRRRLLAAADIGAAMVGALAAGLIEGAATAVWALALLPLWILIAKAQGLYEADHVKIRHLTSDETPKLLYWAAICTTVTALVLRALSLAPLSPGAALAMGVTALIAVVVLRGLARALWRRLVPPERGLVVGTGRLAEEVARKLVLERGHHLSLAVTVAPQNGRPGFEPDADRLRRVIVDEQIERVVLATPELDESALSDVISVCRARGVKLSVAPPLRAMFGTAVELSHIAELPLIEYRTWDPSRSTMAVKRTLDVAVSATGLVLTAPLFAIVALLIKVDSRGPVFFRQVRAGQSGNPFKIYKFRTMVPGAAARVAERAPSMGLREPMLFKLKNDPRTTRAGRFLRRTSLDELPQLVNVLKGEMSLVGPRPEEMWLVDRYGETERFRLQMRPGMTGPMQIHGRAALTFGERLAVEREYVENYSFRKDLQILVRTVSEVVRGTGAY